MILLMMMMMTMMVVEYCEFAQKALKLKLKIWITKEVSADIYFLFP